MTKSTALNGIIISLVVALVFSLFSTLAWPDQGSMKRWYTSQQIANGKVLFQQHCAECHGQQAVGTPNWKVRLPDGSLPPPPLNGTAHTWHHQMPVLRLAITDGSQSSGGKMPGFRDKLSDQQIDSIIAWFQSLWNDEIYALWSGYGIERIEQPDILKNLLKPKK
jgi:mono/diheme cytochrome c family protein